MKTNLIRICLVLTVLIAGCSKKEEPTPAPDLAAKVAGTYQISSITLGTQTQTFPQPGRSGTFKLEKKGSSLTQVEGTATTNINGTIASSSPDLHDLVANGNDVDFLFKGVKSGSWSNNVITLSSTFNGQNITYVAKK